MAQVTTQHVIRVETTKSTRVAAVAWLITAVFYFYQYSLRSAPGVMMPQLSEAFGLSAVAVASIVGIFYYGYSPFSLVAGAAMDRVGPKRLLPLAAGTVGIGSLMFATGNQGVASAGRFLQGAGGVFALIGAIYIVTQNFPASRAATLIGATQMFGMAGGSAGQFAVGPMIGNGLGWREFWLGMGVLGLVIAGLLVLLVPRERSKAPADSKTTSMTDAFKVVFRNPQSILCGFIAGLLFIPTTIFDMIWGVRFLEAHGLDFGSAVMRSATVPFGWIIGCPLLGFISDRLGRRKPVIIGGGVVLLGCLAWILFGPTNVLPPFTLGLLTGIASGAAMLPYTVIKEANPPELGGTATGVINFINFTFSALLAPVFGRLLVRASDGSGTMEVQDYQTAFLPMLFGVGIAIMLALLLRETGPAVQGRN